MEKQRFKHTERTAQIYNSMIKEYREIICDSDLERVGLTYEEYKSSDFGFFLDMLRYEGWAITASRNVSEWAKRHGCNVYMIDSDYKVEL